MKKKHWLIIATITAIYIMGTKKAFSKVVSSQKIRDCDPFGCGSFGASRGSRKHKGIDIISTPNQLIASPISGEITRFPFPYGNDLSYTGIEIVNTTHKVKMFYVKPIVAIGKKVFAGEIIAKSQDIAAKYSPKMTNHVHVEVYKKSGNNWILIDPTNLF
jgi:murein DD-endopeptidase MepM/ murein hydrolase activator NlpD